MTLKGGNNPMLKNMLNACSCGLFTGKIVFALKDTRKGQELFYYHDHFRVWRFCSISRARSCGD